MESRIRVPVKEGIASASVTINPAPNTSWASRHVQMDENTNGITTTIQMDRTGQEPHMVCECQQAANVKAENSPRLRSQVYRRIRVGRDL